MQEFIAEIPLDDANFEVEFAVTDTPFKLTIYNVFMVDSKDPKKLYKVKDEEGHLTQRLQKILLDSY